MGKVDGGKRALVLKDASDRERQKAAVIVRSSVPPRVYYVRADETAQKRAGAPRFAWNPDG